MKISIIDNDEKVIEYLYYWNRPISPGNLCNHLKIKHSTLNSVLTRLQKRELINWEKYSLVELTITGKEKAEHLSNHHFIIEKFLFEVLSLSKETAHNEALLLSPHMSCNVIEAICNKMDISHQKVNKDFCNERDYL